MSVGEREPVAWRMQINGGNWYFFRSEDDARRATDEEYERGAQVVVVEALYTSDDPDLCFTCLTELVDGECPKCREAV